MSDEQTMIDRVTQAIFDAFGEHGLDMEELALQNGRLFINGDIDAKLLARAAVEAMREPTPTMLKAGDLPGWDDSVSIGLAGEVWAAMIAAALPSP